MTYDIYFHNDFDGRASAAVMLAFFSSRGDTVSRFLPVDYTIKSRWTKEDFFKKRNTAGRGGNPAVVVDFLYHPKAAFWFDHHETTFKLPSWEKRFKPDKFHQLNPSYPSCCHLVLDSLIKGFGFKTPAHIRELARWLDVVDGALYKNSRQTIEMKEPALQINEFIERYKGANSLSWLIKLLATRSLASVARDARVTRAISSIRKKRESDLLLYRRSLRRNGKTVHIDLVPYPGRELRFAPFYLYPDITYALALKRKSHGMVHIGVSSNPWRRRACRLHIGELLKRYGGGGHRYVGGVEVKGKRQATALRDRFIKILNDAR
jgi:hypothetical protein